MSRVFGGHVTIIGTSIFMAPLQQSFGDLVVGAVLRRRLRELYAETIEEPVPEEWTIMVKTFDRSPPSGRPAARDLASERTRPGRRST